MNSSTKDGRQQHTADGGISPRSARRARRRDRRDAARVEAAARARRQRLILIAGIGAAVLLAAAAVGVRVRRTGLVYVSVDEIAGGASFADLVESRLRDSAADGANRESPALRIREPWPWGSHDASVGWLAATADLTVRGADDAAQAGAPIAVAWDPLVVVFDQRVGSLPDDLTLADLERFAAVARDAGYQVPLMLAGDPDADFALISAHFAAELLSGRERRDALATLTGSATAASANSETAIDAFLATVQPVVTTLGRWRDEGYLDAGWTDRDGAALREALRSGLAPLAITRRSEVARLEWDERFFLRTRRLPVAPGRRTFTMVARVVAVTRGSGARADAYHRAALPLLADAAQESIEADTILSPLVLRTAPLNRDHREVTRWYANAGELVVMSPDAALSAALRALHTVLR